MVRFLKLGLIGLVWLLVANSTALAQSAQGSITGVVTDPRGAAVVAASVTVTETNTNVRRTTTTNGSGLYNFPDLPPGTYMLSVSAPGFKEAKSSSINLVAAASSRFDATLDVGRVSESVTVSATAPTLNAETPETGDLRTGEDVVREPIARSVAQLMDMTPGTVEGGNSHTLIGGQRSNYENLTIDGITTMNNIFGGQSGAMTADQSFESVAEVKIVDGNGSAENPGFTSLITTTKSGTNQLHGSAFYTTDNAALNATQFHVPLPFTGPKGPELQWYGGSIGGPVWIPKVYNGHNKTFFFVSWEHRTFPLAAGNAFISTPSLPTVAFSHGDFSSLLLPGAPGGPIQLTDPFTGNAIPGNIFANDPNLTISSVAQALQSNYYPSLPNPTPTGAEFQNDASFLLTSPEHINREDFRIDHHFSDRDTISGRFTRQVDPQPTKFRSGTPILFNSRETVVDNTYISETHTFSANILNEFRVGYSRDNRLFTPSHDGNAVLSKIGLNLGFPVAAGTRGFPQIKFSDIQGMFEQGSAVDLSQEYSLLDNVNWQKGNHSIKAGILLRYGRPQISAGNGAQQFGVFNFGGAFTGFDYADFLLGLPTSISQSSNFPSVYFRKTDTGWFVQDSWHATPKLTLTYGLRWEYYMPPVDKNGRRVNFDPATGNIVVPNKNTLALFNLPVVPAAVLNNAEVSSSSFPGSSLLEGRKTDFAPRFGFAYLLSRQTVIRGGYGLYFGQLINAVQDDLENGGLFGTSTGTVFNSITGGVPAFQFPSPFANLPSAAGNTCTVGCIDVTGTDPHIKTPTVQQWNVTVERELSKSLVARATYRGFMTTQLPVTNDLTVPQTPGAANNFPLYNSVEFTKSGGIQKLSALDLTLERKFTHGLTFQLAYTLEKNRSDDATNNLGDGEGDSPQNPYNLAADMGNVFFTPRHRMVNNIIWDVPVGRGRSFGSGMPKALDYAVGGWELSILNVFQSGDFLTPIYSSQVASNGVLQDIRNNNGTPLRPDCNGSLSASRSASNWFNTAAITAPAFGQYGTCGVGIVQGPGSIGFSLGIHKNFTLSEKTKLRFEVNMMNALNHPNPGDPGTDKDGNFFGALDPTNFNANANTFAPEVTTANGERHIWMGLRLDF